MGGEHKKGKGVNNNQLTSWWEENKLINYRVWRGERGNS